MKRQLWLVALASALSLLGTNAWSCAPDPFTGAYVGGALGYGRQRVEINNVTLGTKFRDNDDSVSLAGYAGYNWRTCEGFVFGPETDFNFLNTSPTALDVETGPTGLTETTSLDSKIDWFGTLRGRVGFLPIDTLLLYATGGLAYASVDHTLSDNCVGCGNSPINLGPFVQSNKNTKVGWTAGGGGEYLLGPHWLFRAEALFVDLGSETHTYVITAPAGTATATAKWDDQFWVARLGVTYGFGGP